MAATCVSTASSPHSSRVITSYSIHYTKLYELIWLTFDKKGESANTFSRQALEELSSALDEIRAKSPRGLIIRSAKDSFIAGADINSYNFV